MLIHLEAQYNSRNRGVGKVANGRKICDGEENLTHLGASCKDADHQ